MAYPASAYTQQPTTAYLTQHQPPPSLSLHHQQSRQQPQLTPGSILAANQANQQSSQQQQQQQQPQPPTGLAVPQQPPQQPPQHSPPIPGPSGAAQQPGQGQTHDPISKLPYGAGGDDDGYTLVFPNLAEFQAWREKEEIEQCVDFVKGDVHGSRAVPPRFKEHTKLVCARHVRSGRKKYIKKHPERQRKLPSRKLEGIGCSASISYKTYFDSEQVRACYNSAHSHAVGPENYPFTRRGRKQMANERAYSSKKRAKLGLLNSSQGGGPGSNGDPDSDDDGDDGTMDRVGHYGGQDDEEQQVEHHLSVGLGPGPPPPPPTQQQPPPPPPSSQHYGQQQPMYRHHAYAPQHHPHPPPPPQTPHQPLAVPQQPPPPQPKAPPPASAPPSSSAPTAAPAAPTSNRPARTPFPPKNKAANGHQKQAPQPAIAPAQTLALPQQPPPPPPQAAQPPPPAAQPQMNMNDPERWRWERLTTMFESIKANARGFEYPQASLAALEATLVRLTLESPLGPSGSG